MKATVTWNGGVSFVGASASGHSVVLDGPPEAGGRGLGMRPMEMLLIGMGACSAVDVVSILTKARQAVVDCRVELSAERAATAPKVFTRIHAHFVVTGRALNRAQLARALRLSLTKYCSAAAMLRHTAEITHDFEIIEIDAAP